MNRQLDPNQVAGDECVVGRMKALTPAQARADVLAALEEATVQCERDAGRLGGSTHGRFLAALAKKWRDVLTAHKASGA